jgi:hypothetical protein
MNDEPIDTDSLDDSLARLRDNATRWATLSMDRRLELARSFRDRTRDAAADQVTRALEAKQLSPDDPQSAEEWLAGPLISLRYMRMLIETLEEIREHGHPECSVAELRRRAGGQVVADVVPHDLWDRLLYNGFRAEVWMDPELDAQEVCDSMGSFYRQEEADGAVELVLGAGNVASIGPLDTISKLFVEGRVCLLKVNPVNAYLEPFWRARFKPFIDEGFVDIVTGGAEVGSYLCHHDDVDHIHITGSDKTHDAIVFGSGEDDGRLDKPITSELGNVSPVIVLPGPWGERDVDFHAQNLATQLANNAGFNCNAVRAIVRPRGWDIGERLIDRTLDYLEDVGTRHAYYPGAADRFSQFVESHDRVDTVGTPGDGELPWAILRDVDPTSDHPAFREEAFCGATAETLLEAETPADFLRRAVRFCNESLWGTLNACLIVHPETKRQLGETLESAISELRYGTVAINHWPALGYGLGLTPWGAYPGSSLEDIQSGRGWVHNARMFEHPQKSVLRGPFHVTPTPPWFVTNPSAHEIAPKLAEFEADPSLRRFGSILWPILLNEIRS